MEHSKRVQHTLTRLFIVFLFAALVLGSAVPALAINGSVTITIPDEIANTGKDVELSLYKLGHEQGKNEDGSMAFACEPEFSEIWDAISKIEEALRKDTPMPSNRDQTLTKIRSVISQKSISPVDVQIMDKTSKTVKFENLEPGIYFAVMTKGPANQTLQTSIIPVPYTYIDKETGKYNVLYGITTNPKSIVIPPPPPPPPPPDNPPPTSPPSSFRPTPSVVKITEFGVNGIFNHVGDCYE